MPAGSSSFRTRFMVLEDVARVREIDSLSFSMPWPESSYRFEVSENSHARAWVVEAVFPDGRAEIAAMMVNWIIFDEVHIATIAVHPDYRRRSLGRKLLAHGLLDGFDRGALLAMLEVRRGNLAAQALYLEFGFAVVGERLRYYQDNHEDALLMNLEPIHPEHIRALGGLAAPANS